MGNLESLNAYIYAVPLYGAYMRFCKASQAVIAFPGKINSLKVKVKSLSHV